MVVLECNEDGEGVRYFSATLYIVVEGRNKVTTMSTETLEYLIS